MNTKIGSRGLASKLQRTLLAALALIIMFASVPSGQVRAAGSSVGLIGTSVTCLGAKYSFNPGFVGTYDGQWVYFRLWARNNVTGVYQPTSWTYIQAYTSAVGGFYDVPAARGSIVSIITEAYFYNRTTSSWDYAGKQYAHHWQMTVYGSSLTSCRIY